MTTPFWFCADGLNDGCLCHILQKSWLALSHCETLHHIMWETNKRRRTLLRALLIASALMTVGCNPSVERQPEVADAGDSGSVTLRVMSFNASRPRAS
jgi:hypothetical protein